jgi:hypothetical protein
MDTIQINKFSHLHDGLNIIFCKTDFLIDQFEEIKRLKNSVTLISGNSDLVIDEDLYKMKPNNVTKWYAQNAMFTNQILELIPIGIENRFESARSGHHGVGYYERVEEKQDVFDSFVDITPTKFIYSNFNISTNFYHRSKIREICIESDFIDWEEPNLTSTNFLKRILEYEAVICPQGNGPGDNHRIYETLYMNRIPITFNKVMYDNLHKLFPVLLIEDINELHNSKLLKEKIFYIKNKYWDKNLLTSEYWINKIKNKI